MDGKTPTGEACTGEDSKIYAQFRVSYFVNQEWEQTWELTYLTVSKDAREHSFKQARTMQDSHQSFFRLVETEWVERFDKLPGGDVRYDLFLALGGTMYIAHRELCSNTTSMRGWPTLVDRKMAIRLDAYKEGPGREMHQIVPEVYNDYRHGLREPEEKFLRFATRVEI